MTHPTRSRLGAGLALALLVAACGSVATPATPASSSPGIEGTPPVAADPTPVPGGSGDPGGLVPGGGTGVGPGGGTGGGGGSEPGNPGGGDGTVTSPPNPGGGGDPTNPEPTMVVPGTGLTGIHQVGATKLEVTVNGRDVAVRIAWWSGVAPCSVLAGVGVVRDGTTFTLTVTEGSGGSGVACIEIAMYKATIVDLGSLDPGTYTITAFGDARAIQVTVPA